MPFQRIFAALLLLAAPVFLEARSGSRSGSHSSKSRSERKAEKSGAVSHNEAARTHHAQTYCASCERDKRGKIKRSPQARAAFRRQHPCPSTNSTSGGCPGFVVDHVKPLKRGGADAPSNMRWQTVAEAKAKDRVED